MNIGDIADVSVRDLAEFCDKEYFSFPIVQRVESPDDLQRVSEQMGILTGYSSFLGERCDRLTEGLKEGSFMKETDARMWYRRMEDHDE